MPLRSRRGSWGIRAALAIVLALGTGCAAPRSADDWISVREVTPSFLTSGSTRDAALAADTHGRVALTFVTHDSTGKNLWLSVSRDSGTTFGPPARVNPRPGKVDSYPESRPIAVFGPGGELAVAWSEKRSE